MEKRTRYSLLAALVLHILPLAIFISHARSPVVETQGERVLDVAIYSKPTLPETDAGETEILPNTADYELEKEMPPTGQVADALQTAQPGEDVTASLPPAEAPYLPAGELDARPYPEAPVVIPYPDAQLNQSKATGVLVLYIDADGHVERIEIDKSELPPEFEKAAVDTFMKARMQPGMKGGKPIRARMKILVEFEQR